MAIEPEDLNLIRKLRSDNPDGNSCAILGDCNISGYTSLDQFGNDLDFEKVHTFDVVGNPTHKINLNEDIPENLRDSYDWVIDSGTLYCCFDIATVWKNILGLLTRQGKILHTSNISGFYGRGFYSLSPALFRDFYKANGFNILYSATKTRLAKVWQEYSPDDTYLRSSSPNSLDFQGQAGEYHSTIPNDALMACFAERVETKQFTKPLPQHFVNTDGK